jgi:hypothetical protein
MEAESADFRLAKDVGIVLLVEALTPGFGRRIWDYVLEAGYEHRQASAGEPQFYRFRNLKSSRYPEMLELFSRHIDGLRLPQTAQATPIPFGHGLRKAMLKAEICRARAANRLGQEGVSFASLEQAIHSHRHSA